MEDVQDHEVQPSLVLHLNPIKLSEDTRTETNAKLLNDGYDLSVDTEHYFLVLMRFDVQRYLLQPLFSDPGDLDREKLVPRLKTGLADKWTDRDSYVFKWHHWLAPVSAILDAIHEEETDQNNRRRYADGDRNRLSALAATIVRNRTYFHRPNPAPKENSN